MLVYWEFLGSKTWSFAKTQENKNTCGERPQVPHRFKVTLRPKIKNFLLPVMLNKTSFWQRHSGSAILLRSCCKYSQNPWIENYVLITLKHIKERRSSLILESFQKCKTKLGQPRLTLASVKISQILFPALSNKQTGTTRLKGKRRNFFCVCVWSLQLK